MASTFLILAVVTISSCIHATTISKPTTLYPNSTKAEHSGTSTTSFCCFAIQDTITEEYWAMTAYTTTVILVNLTSITTLITPYPNTTYTSFKTNVYPTNRTRVVSYDEGLNPISNYPNIAPGPLEIQNEIDNVTEIITAGVTIQSPAAFYVYTTVKIITAAAVTDEHGQVVCGTTSSIANAWSGNAVPMPTFANINANAEAYFGGFGIVGQNEIFYTDTGGHDEVTTVYSDSAGNEVIQSKTPSGVVISLTTPFIYKPARGANGSTGDFHACQAGGTEYYGYVPQTVLDFLISNSNYSAQYPGLASCLPGGPSIIAECVAIAPHFQEVAPDLTESTVVYITPTVGAQPTLKGAYTPNTPTPLSHSSSSPPPPISSLTSTSLAQSGGSGLLNGALPSSPVTPGSTSQSISLSSVPLPIEESPTGVAGSAGAIPGKPPIAVPGSPTQSQPIVSIGGTIIPTGSAILAAGAPNGLSGTTTTSGTPFFIIPNAALSLSTGLNFPTSVIRGTPFPAISNPTTIPVAGTPSGLVGTTTTTSGTPFLVIPSPTMIVAPTYLAGPGFSTTIINGTSFLFIPGPTNVPFSLAPSGLSGDITTYISGSSFLVILEPTAIPLPTPISLGQLTIISGTTELIINGPTVKPVNLDIPLQGNTTVISGTTMVIVSSAKTVSMTGPLQNYAQVSAAANNIGRMGIRISLVRLFVGILISRFCLFAGMGCFESDINY